MLWLILILLAVAATVPIAAAKGMPCWGWLVISVIAAGAECVLVGKPSPSWETKYVVASWVLTIILPWVAVAMFLWTNRDLSHPIFTVLGLLIVYVIFTVIGLVVGDMSGLIPQ